MKKYGVKYHFIDGTCILQVMGNEDTFRIYLNKLLNCKSIFKTMIQIGQYQVINLKHVKFIEIEEIL